MEYKRNGSAVSFPGLTGFIFPILGMEPICCERTGFLLRCSGVFLPSAMRKSSGRLGVTAGGFDFHPIVF